MFKRLFEKKQTPAETSKDEQRRLIRLAEENGIYIPPAYKPVGYTRPTHGRYGWYASSKRRAEIAERELKKKGLI